MPTWRSRRGDTPELIKLPVQPACFNANATCGLPCELPGRRAVSLSLAAQREGPERERRCLRFNTVGACKYQLVGRFSRPCAPSKNLHYVPLALC